jgi:hypothetical protein
VKAQPPKTKQSLLAKVTISPTWRFSVGSVLHDGLLIVIKFFLLNVETKTEEVSLADLGGEAAKFHQPGKDYSFSFVLTILLKNCQAAVVSSNYTVT